MEPSGRGGLFGLANSEMALRQNIKISQLRLGSDRRFGDVVTYIAFLFHPVLSSIFSIAIVMLEVAIPR
jgi:hypothetical protein